MLANIGKMLPYFGAHHSDIITCVVIMVSSIIMLMGILKPILFNRIANKHIRKAVLALSSIAMCFLAALVYFLIQGWNLKYYFVASFALSVACIMTYWFYENTCLRNLINLIGGLALRKALNIVRVALTTEDVEAIKQELKNVTEELQDTTKVELKKAVTPKTKGDKDLKGL